MHQNPDSVYNMSGRIGPGIVARGLVMYLDAANKSSYPSSGTTWYDLTTNNNSGSLVNGPTYDSTNGGSIVFDGTNDYVNISKNSIFNLITSTTINVWRKHQNTEVMIAYDKSGWLGYSINSNGVVYSGASGLDDFYYSISPAPTLNQWGMLTFIVDRENSLYKIYFNGELNYSKSITQPALSLTTPLYIGGRAGVGDMWYSGNISQISYYSRALSTTEILQNYNALKCRFGL